MCGYCHPGDDGQKSIEKEPNKSKRHLSQILPSRFSGLLSIFYSSLREPNISSFFTQLTLLPTALLYIAQFAIPIVNHIFILFIDLLPFIPRIL